MDEKSYTRLYNKLCQLVHIENIQELSIHDIFSLLQKAMECVERYESLTGIQKKQMVLKAMQHIIDSKIGDNMVIKPTILSLLEPCIDTIIAVSKSEWLLNLKKGTSCCKFL